MRVQFAVINASLLVRLMMAPSDIWIKEYNEASKLGDDINGMISERSSFPATGPDSQRHASAIRRKITILGTKVDGLESLLLKLPVKQPLYVCHAYTHVELKSEYSYFIHLNLNLGI